MSRFDNGVRALRDRTTRLKAVSAERFRRLRAGISEHDWRISPGGRRRIYWTGGIIGGSVVALVLLLAIFDWNYLKGPVQGYLSARADRPVRIEGDLDVNILSWTPGATLEGLAISNPAWVEPEGPMARIERLSVKIKLLPLFWGDVIIPELKIEQPDVQLVRLEDGRNNWTLGRGEGGAFSLPPIRRFEISNGDLQIDDAVRRLVFQGTINSSEVEGEAARDAFKLLGDGTLNAEPFDMEITGGPLLNVDPNKPYPFNARVLAGATSATARGEIGRPFDLAVFDADLTVSGDDLANLYYLTGLTLPNTPPYETSGHLRRRGATFAYEGLTADIGDSDLAGDLSVLTGGERLMLVADLRSELLSFSDLATILGGGSDTRAGNDASPEQAAAARELAATGRLFPDTPLQVERLRSMDARLTYAAASVASENLPVRAGSVELSLDDGVLDLNPLVFDLANGRTSGQLIINAQQDVPAINMDMRLSEARIDQFIPARFEGAVSGGLVGRAQLSSTGLSVRQAASNANGQFTLVVPSGEMRESLAELLGVNVLRGLFTDPGEATSLRCAVADFKVTNGVMQAQTLVVDTDPVIATGGGTVDLGAENMSLSIKGHPKEARFVRLSAPMELNGRIRNPTFSVDTDTAIAQGGAAAALGAFLSPLAAILPFVDPGLAEDANCGALVERAGSGNPAPVNDETARRQARQDRG